MYYFNILIFFTIQVLLFNKISIIFDQGLFFTNDVGHLNYF